MKRFLLSCWLVTSALTLAAQDYEGAVGLRGGVSSGITYKIVLNDERAFEGIFSFRRRGIQLTGLVLNHQPFLFKVSDKIFAYHGMGVHVGYYGRGRCRHNTNSRHECDYSRDFSPSIGIDGMLGVEYRILKIPLILAVDYKPYIDVFGQQFFYSNFYDFAFAAKYTF
jgi:hypothetical protein